MQYFRRCGIFSAIATLNTGGVILPKSVIEIGAYAFYNCNNLIGNLDLSNVKSIGSYAFSECSNIEGTLTLCKDMYYISSDTFSGCGFAGKLEIPDGVSHIGQCAFWGCWNITEIYIGNCETH